MNYTIEVSEIELRALYVEMSDKQMKYYSNPNQLHPKYLLAIDSVVEKLSNIMLREVDK